MERMVEATRRFSWKQGLVHALVPLAYVMVVGGLLSGLNVVARPYELGRALGRASVFLMLAALGVSYLAQTGRRGPAIGLGVALAVVVVGGTVAALVVMLSLARAGATGL